jgi:hypothetical protein
LFQIFLLGVLPAVLVAQIPATSRTNRLVDSISLDSLGTHITGLESAGGHFSRVNFTPGNDSGAAYIRRAFDALPYLTSVENDTFYIPSATPPLNAKPLINVIGTLQGKKDPLKVFVLGAHLDCSASRMGTQLWNQQWRTLRAPGADDNATGVAAVLEIARVLSDPASGFMNDYTIRFVAFGAEESGPAYSGSHHGSTHYAQLAKARSEEILGMVSMDMIGFNQRYYYQSIISDAASTWLAELFVSANANDSIGLITSTPPFPYATYSDHASFWTEGYPAICLIEYAPPWNNGTYYLANPYYHTSGDSLRTLNLELVRKVTQMTLAGVVSLNNSVTGLEQGIAQVPSMHALHQNYPNPFNPTTTIRYEIPVRTYDNTSLRIYDLLGREVAVLVDDMKEPGTYTVQFDASGLASGAYLYRLIAGDFIQTKRLMVVK